MRYGGLFEGFGGFSIAAKEMGWDISFQCEIDPFCQQILNYWFPESQLHGDIRNTDFTIYRDQIDILCGGFPCQPFSVAGKGEGTADDRHLWPEMFRAIREIRPRYVVAENVPGILTIEGGMVFEQVCADLESEGYEVQPVIIPAAGVGAPHKRDRVWIIAYSDRRSLQGRSESRQRENQTQNIAGLDNRFERHGDFGPVAKAGGSGWGQLDPATIAERQRHRAGMGAFKRLPTWERFPTQSPVCGRNDGLPGGLDFNAIFRQYTQGDRLTKKQATYAKWRRESIKGFGNAVVPLIPFIIFQSLPKLNYDR